MIMARVPSGAEQCAPYGAGEGDGGNGAAVAVFTTTARGRQ